MKFFAADPTISVNLPNKNDLGTTVNHIVNFLIYGAAILSVIFVLVGAFQYVTSAGNPDSTRKAKDTIMYALIGLVVAVAAYAIVKFVLGGLK